MPRWMALSVRNVVGTNRWSCRFSPTGRSATTPMSCSARCAAGPTPESISICGEPKTPAERMTSLPARMVRRRPLPVDHVDPDRAAVADDDLGDVDLGLHLEPGGLQAVDVATGGGVAQAGVAALLEVADPFLLLGVVVLEDLHAEGVRGGLLELGGRLDRAGVPLHLDRATGTAEVAGAALVVLDALVDVVDRVGVPAGVALRRPAVVVRPVAAHPEHPVDGARPTEHLAAGLRNRPVEHVLLRSRVVAPVDQRLDLRHGVHRADHPRLLHQELLVTLACLEQDHARTRLGQPGGSRTASASSAHDDVVGAVTACWLHGDLVLALG